MNIANLKYWAKRGKTAPPEVTLKLISEIERLERAMSATEELWREERQQNRAEDEEERLG